MTFHLVVDMSNDAFGDSPELELARILERLGEYLASHGMMRDAGSCFDVNGNTVGGWSIEADDAGES